MNFHTFISSQSILLPPLLIKKNYMSSMEVVRQISKCTVKPRRNLLEKEPPRCDLTAWDVAMLSAHYIQKGLLFYNPSSQNQEEKEPIINQLKDSLSRALVHFYPLAGRLVTKKHSSSSSSSSSPSFVFIECNGQGAEFIHAVAEKVSISDILSPIDVPEFVKSFFPLDGAVNYDGHSLPLLAIQLTELVDGIFVGCSFNHTVGDGTSYWHFFNAWSELSRKGKDSELISRPPIFQRWYLPDLDKTLIRLPSSHPEEFIERYSPPLLRERIFHFSIESMTFLKKKANEEYKTNKISSFQALCAHIWRAITRTRHLPVDQKTSCRLAINNRTRLDPPLSTDYFGNCIQALNSTTTVGDLLSKDLGSAAWLLHQSVVEQTDGVVRGVVEAWTKGSFVHHLSGFDCCSVMVGSSPRFDMYGNDFGWGKAVGVRSGNGNKFDGKISSYPGIEGGGSVDLELCLLPDSMRELELDEEFMDVVSTL
ncbi:uncharacterized protein LOC143846321 [Tasmannia lanceolata]|uniref:uncharacterized protein LOC143846321 n=1 Tax=Tasmannia lanceolata TaxID=3420 RepID=UPI0040631B3A